jgi:hypothetical protein
MSGWLRYFALNAQSRTGLSAAVLTAAVIAAVAAVGAAVFLLIALFIWLADIYDGVIAGVVLGGAFALIALIALIACVMIRRGNMERARLELAARSSNWFDPKFLTVAAQIGQTIGWRRLASLAALAILAAGVTRELSGREKADGGSDEASSEG